MKKYLLAVLLILIFAVAVVFAQEVTVPVAKDIDAQFAVFPAGYDLTYAGIKGERCALSIEQARQADVLITGFMRKQLEDVHGTVLTSYYRNDVKDILPNLSKYRRQCFGVLNEKGELIIWINYFLYNPKYNDFPKWQEDLVQVNDGGSAYFNAKVNLNTGEVFDFIVNGVA